MNTEVLEHNSIKLGSNCRDNNNCCLFIMILIYCNRNIPNLISNPIFYVKIVVSSWLCVSGKIFLIIRTNQPFGISEIPRACHYAVVIKGAKLIAVELLSRNCEVLITVHSHMGYLIVIFPVQVCSFCNINLKNNFKSFLSEWGRRVPYRKV